MHATAIQNPHNQHGLYLSIYFNFLFLFFSFYKKKEEPNECWLILCFTVPRQNSTTEALKYLELFIFQGMSGHRISLVVSDIQRGRQLINHHLPSLQLLENTSTHPPTLPPDPPMLPSDLPTLPSYLPTYLHT